MEVRIYDPNRQPSTTYSNEEWNKYKGEVVSLRDHKTIKEIGELLGEKGFHVTPRQIKRKLDSWGVPNRNIRLEPGLSQYLGSILDERAKKDQRSGIRIGNRILDEMEMKNVLRTINRNRLKSPSMLSVFPARIVKLIEIVRSPDIAPNPSVSVFTPGGPVTHPPVSPLSANPAVPLVMPPLPEREVRVSSRSTLGSPASSFATLPTQLVPALEVAEAPQGFGTQETGHALELFDHRELNKALEMSPEPFDVEQEDGEEQSSYEIVTISEELRPTDWTSAKCKGREVDHFADMPTNTSMLGKRVASYGGDDGDAELQAALHESLRFQNQRHVLSVGESSRTRGGTSAFGRGAAGPLLGADDMEVDDAQGSDVMACDMELDGGVVGLASQSLAFEYQNLLLPTSPRNVGPSESFPPLFHMAMGSPVPPALRSISPRRPYWDSPPGRHGQWPVQIPIGYIASVYAMVFLFTVADLYQPSEWPQVSKPQKSLYQGYARILDLFLDSLQIFETCIDCYLFAKYPLTNASLKGKALEIKQAIAKNFTLVPNTMAERKIWAELAKRRTRAIVCSFLGKSLRLIGAEEVHFISGPGELDVKFSWLGILDVVCRGDEAAFTRLKEEIRSSYNRVKDMCLGLKGVLFLVEMTVKTLGDDELKAQVGLQIQERVKEVLGAIDLADAESSRNTFSSGVGSEYRGGGRSGGARSNDSQGRQGESSGSARDQSPGLAVSPSALFSALSSSPRAMDEYLQECFPTASP